MQKMLGTLQILHVVAVTGFICFCWFTFTLVSRARNHAERIFALMPEKNAHSYCTMIRGMVKVTFVLGSFMFGSLISTESGFLSLRTLHSWAT